MTNDPEALAQGLLDAAHDLHAIRETEEVLRMIAQVAVTSLPGIDHAGVSLSFKDGRIETQAGTGDLVWQLDALQYELGEGPCVDAILSKGPSVVIVNNIRHDQRWPHYVPRALEYGLTAQMGLQLAEDGHVYGGLNLYSTSTPTIDPDVEHIAELLAAHAAVALGRSRREADLTAAMVTRSLIGQATGILMERYELDSDRAFGYLIRLSQQSNTKLRDLAHDLVEQTDRQNRPPR